MFEGRRYISPFTDFGFKKLFGEEPNKELLLDFLNELLRAEKGTIKDLTYKKCERLDDCPDGRKVCFDLFCETDTGEKFIVEMQNTWQRYFKDRVLFYATYPIRDQFKESDMGGDWDYYLKPVYVVSVVNFVLDREKMESGTPPGLSFRRDAMLMDKATYEIFYDKLTLIFLQMPLFNKTVDELETRFDKWLYVLKNLHRLDRVPEILRERIFEKFFAIAEIARLTEDERVQYESNLKNTLDYYSGLSSYRYLGKEEGRVEREIEIAKNMLSIGLDIETIAKVTGISVDGISRF